MADRIEDLQKRLAKDPGSKIFAQLAEEYRKAGMLREAIVTCREGLSRHPTYFSARVALGRALLEAGSYEEARVELEKVLAQVPDNILAHKFLAEACFNLDRLEEALEKYQMVAALAPGDPEIVERILQIKEATDRLRRVQPPPIPVMGTLQDREFEEPEQTVIAASEKTLAEPPRASSTDPVPEGEMIFDAEEAAAGEAEVVLEEAKPITSIFERQAREVRQSSEVSEEARALQEEFESTPVTSTFKRQAREILGGAAPEPPERKAAPQPAQPAAEPEEEFAVGELTSYFLGRQPAVPSPPPAPPLAESPPAVQSENLDRIPSSGLEVERVPGTESYAYLGHEESTPVLPSEEQQAASGLTSEALADLYISQGHLDQALALLRNLLSAQPTQPELRRKVEELEVLVRASRPTPAPAPLVRAAAVAPASAAAGGVQEVIRALEGWLEAIRRR